MNRKCRGAWAVWKRRRISRAGEPADIPPTWPSESGEPGEHFYFPRPRAACVGHWHPLLPQPTRARARVLHRNRASVGRAFSLSAAPITKDDAVLFCLRDGKRLENRSSVWPDLIFCLGSLWKWNGMLLFRQFKPNSIDVMSVLVSSVSVCYVGQFMNLITVLQSTKS